MNFEHVEMFLELGQAFIPVNVKNKGDSVKILLRDGSEKVLDMQCELFFSRLLSHFGASVSANRSRYGGLVGKKQLVPIALSYGITLVPYIVREPVGKQTRIGWLLAKEISRFRRKSDKKTAVLMGKNEITVLHSERFCLEQLKNACCIELSYGQIHEPHRKNWIFSAG
ncbi:hypothetical protein ABET51_15905 [Metabacillus fastidiosus]|uniref:hypothetical protein n=1 Tax=Metabacillus fastidiosus TaxID=1458 RepID=UPI002E21240E|nr:hypothetical protein [Metabacillus fastidiosus]